MGLKHDCNDNRCRELYWCAGAFSKAPTVLKNSRLRVGNLCFLGIAPLFDPIGLNLVNRPLHLTVKSLSRWLQALIDACFSREDDVCMDTDRAIRSG